MNSTGVEITAGLGGFLVLFGLMLAVWFLGRDMTKRLRRMRLAEDERVAEVRRQRAERRGAKESPGGSERDGAERDGAERDGAEHDGREADEPERDDPIG